MAPPPITDISTHTPLAGRDCPFDSCCLQRADFYSHAPRGARHLTTSPSRLSNYFYSHAPRGARRPRKQHRDIYAHISTHTPLAGRDSIFAFVLPPLSNFYSHAPRGARRNHSPCLFFTRNFYSHAPRGARLQPHGTPPNHRYFYSHAPRGARLPIRFMLSSTSGFLLTRPSRGATFDNITFQIV